MRFIPTPVGNTPNLPPFLNIPSVHPHACGEHCSEFSVFSRPAGSSPRLWGTPLVVVNEYMSNRFIPTPVGNTSFYYI